MLLVKRRGDNEDAGPTIMTTSRSSSLLLKHFSNAFSCDGFSCRKEDAIFGCVVGKAGHFNFWRGYSGKKIFRTNGVERSASPPLKASKVRSAREV